MRKKWSPRTKIILQMVVLFVGIFALIPLTNRETVLNLIVPYFEIRNIMGGGVIYISNLFNAVLLIALIFLFLDIRNYLNKQKYLWRYLLYLFLIFWGITNIRTTIGEKIMSCRKGLETLDLLPDQNNIHFQANASGTMHVQGTITFRNYSSDTIKLQVILHKENFHFSDDYVVADIQLPTGSKTNPAKYLQIPPKTTYPYMLSLDVNLKKLRKSTFNKFSGTINKISKLTVTSEGEKKVFYGSY